MLNETFSGGLTGNAQANVTANLYSAFDLANNFYPILAIITIMTFLYVIIFMPKKIQTLFIGYTTFILTAIIIGTLWVIVKTIKPVSEALWVEWLTPLGKILAQYGIYILVSIPMAYLVGRKVEVQIIPKLENLEGSK